MDFNPPREAPSASWGIADLIAFGSFFIVTLLFLPMVLVEIARVFKPGISITNLSGEAEILIQGFLDLAWVGFIFFLVKAIHRKPILETMRWVRAGRIHTGRLIALGAALAVAVLAVSSFFPPSSSPAIEKLAQSRQSLYFLVAFGILVAPILEEIMFRGFLFGVLNDLGGSRLAVPCTAVLFALLHAPQVWPSKAAIALIFVVGLALSLLRNRFNSLIPSYIVHTAYNTMLFGVSAFATLMERGKN